MPGNDQFTKALLQFDGNLTDSNFGGAAKTWTPTGTVSTAGTPKFGSGALSLSNPNNQGSMQGANNYISTPQSDLWLGDGDWTIDFFLRFPNSDNFFYVASHADDNGISNNLVSWQLSINVVTTGGILFTVTDGTHTAGFNGVGSMSANAYHHVALVRSGTSLKAYIDGSQVGSTTMSFTPRDPARPVWIGSFGLFGGLTGLVDGFRISKFARWTAPFTPPAAPYAIDYSGVSGFGAYTYLGKIITAPLARAILAARGVYSLTGRIATLLYGKFILIAGVGAYAFTGGVTSAFKNGRELFLLLAAGGQYIMSGFTNYLLRAISKFKLGDALTLFKTRRNPPTLDV